MLRVNNMIGFGMRRRGGGAPDFGFTLSSALATTTDADDYTLSSCPIGTPHANRWVGVIFHTHGDNNSIDTPNATIGGSNFDYSETNAYAFSALEVFCGWSNIPTGTTVDIVLDADSVGAAGAIGAIAQVFYFYSALANPLIHVRTNASTLTTADGGAAMFLATANNATVSWDNADVVEIDALDISSGSRMSKIGWIAATDGTAEVTATTPAATRMALAFGP